MTKSLILLTAGLALTASVAFAAGHDVRKDERLPPEGAIVVPAGPSQMSVFDYFFNNPEKYRTMRNDRGEYYQGTERR
ncbi:hypothetical protein SAMN05880582_1011269 [Rhizobium sp. RU20A]|uniref:hypothetical protein n=1 Tax=Rhizobium sp. RU20A TaxID=1907412 RepID=UPI0009544556|nr:hypothetical protein [Rhizobium sp. RU20A]SIQ25755.1 hypothetical protein SAMN05880582_1011269 [Rhizobium sp. RU20A]